jgi:hypothetical protein
MTSEQYIMTKAHNISKLPKKKKEKTRRAARQKANTGNKQGKRE